MSMRSRCVDGIPEHLPSRRTVRGRRRSRHEGVRFRDGVEDGDIAVGGRMVGFVDHDVAERSGGCEDLDEAASPVRPGEGLHTGDDDLGVDLVTAGLHPSDGLAPGCRRR